MNSLGHKQIFILVLLFLVIGAGIFLVFEKEQEKAMKRNREVQIALENIQKEAQKIAKEKAEQKIYLMGKFDPSLREDFAPVPAEYNVSGYKMYLRKEALIAFSKMRAQAEAEGIILSIASATRNFDYQKDLWNKKWTTFTFVDGIARFKKILEYSAVSGTSRHHWGTDIDINDATPEYFNTEDGKKVYAWLTKNAPHFGFCQVYTAKNTERTNGYNEEKWHWSYLPLAKDFTEKYKKLISEKEISGFLGDEYVIDQNVITNYVLSINPECL